MRKKNRKGRRQLNRTKIKADTFFDLFFRDLLISTLKNTRQCIFVIKNDLTILFLFMNLLYDCRDLQIKTNFFQTCRSESVYKSSTKYDQIKGQWYLVPNVCIKDLKKPNLSMVEHIFCTVGAIS